MTALKITTLVVCIVFLIASIAVVWIYWHFTKSIHYSSVNTYSSWLHEVNELMKNEAFFTRVKQEALLRLYKKKLPALAVYNHFKKIYS